MSVDVCDARRVFGREWNVRSVRKSLVGLGAINAVWKRTASNVDMCGMNDFPRPARLQNHIKSDTNPEKKASSTPGSTRSSVYNLCSEWNTFAYNFGGTSV